MKTIGIKLADGSFYPVLEDNTPSEKQLELTTAHNNQTKVMVDLYRSATCSMDDAEYVDSLQIENLTARPNGETDIKFSVSLDEDNQLQARIVDPETGNESNTTITLVSRTLEERLITDDYAINDSNDKDKAGAGALAAGGLLAAAAAAAALHKDKKEDEEESFDTIEETEIPVDESSVDEPVVEDDTTVIADEPAVDEDSLFEEDDTPVVDTDNPVVEPVETTDTDLPDMDFDLPEDTVTEETPAEEETTAEAGDDFSIDETISDDFNLDETVADETVADETVTDETIADESLTDFNLDEPAADETISDDFADDELITEDTGLPDMDFDLPDDTSTDSELENPEMPDDFFKTEDDMKETTFDSPSPAAGLNFDGLYDEETERGTPAETEVDEVKKKTKVPVIICIICAIICIIATLLILFIIPSKYNLITKKHAKEAGTTVAIEQPAPEPEPQPEPEPAVPEAKEDEIVIIEKAEEVVPKQPPVAEEKPKNITYKIKWGDTLWDIADTYYKNPWRYKYIARYNGIKNPDYIISGTKIIIPAE